MALFNTTDPVSAARRLTEWFRATQRRYAGIRVSDVETNPSSGLSTETLLFTASWREGDAQRGRRMVARIEPTGPAPFPSYDLEREHRVMSALRERTSVPVPRMIAYEPDPSYLGAPFVVMDRVAGRVPADDPAFTTEGWVLDLSERQRTTMHDGGLEVLAAIHRADWAGMGLSDLGPGDLDTNLRRAESVFAWGADGEENPVIEAGLAWLRANQPAVSGPVALLWGDARMGNLIFDDDLGVVAVLDWELAALGDPEIDLGWWVFMMRFHTEGMGVPVPSGFRAATTWWCVTRSSPGARYATSTTSRCWRGCACRTF